jgi:hypothetical protein
MKKKLIDRDGNPYIENESWPAGGGLDSRCSYNNECIKAYDLADIDEMGKYLKKFESHSQYEAYAASPAFLCPNVSICVNEKDVHYTQFIHVSSVTLNKNELTLPQD